MSLLSKLWKGVRKVVAPVVGTAIGGPLGGVVGTLLGGSSTKTVAQVPAAVAPSLGSTRMSFGAIPGAGAMLPALPTIGRAVGTLAGVGGAIARGASTAMRSANIYCRRHPAWCAALPGGIGAVAGMIEGGQLPPIKRRRAKGITGTELKNFKRVSRVLNTWCKVPAPTQRAKRKC